HRRDFAGMAAGLGPLGDHDVAPGVLGAARVVDGAAHRHDLHAAVMAAADHWPRDAQAGDERRRAFLDDDVDRRFDLVGQRLQEVDADRLPRLGLHLAHFGADLLRRGADHAERAEAAGFRDRGADVGVRDLAHPGEKNRIFYPEYVADRGAELHGRGLLASCAAPPSQIFLIRDSSVWARGGSRAETVMQRGLTLTAGTTRGNLALAQRAE